MKNKKNSIKYLIIAAALLLAVGVSAVIGGTIAKYRTSINFSQKVKFTVALCDDMIITEHVADRSGDGSYTLKPEATTPANEYKLMPGVDVPKDPFIVITNKTALPGRLYIEVVESDPFDSDNIAYEISDCWTLLKDGENAVIGENGGMIYYYNTELLTNATSVEGEVDNDGGTLTVKDIIKDNTMIISQDLPRGTTAELQFYAYLCQNVSGNALTDWNTIFVTPAPLAGQGD